MTENKKKIVRFPYVPSPEAKKILDTLPPREKTAFINAAVVAAGSDEQKDKIRALLAAAVITLQE